MAASLMTASHSHRLFSLLEDVFVFCALFLITSDLISVVVSRGGETDFAVAAASPVHQVVFAGLYVVAAVLVLARLQRLVRSFRASWAIWALVLLALASAVWSVNPGISVRRGLALVGTTLIASLITLKYSYQRFLLMLATVLGAVAALSVIAVLVVPAYGLHWDDYHYGDWRGIFLHKNRLGRSMALATVVFFLLALKRRQWSSLQWMITAGSLALVGLSGSRSAWLFLIGIAMCFPALLVARRRPAVAGAVLFVLLAAVVTTGFYVASNLPMVMEVLGRDATLTGRTLLWRAAIGEVLQRPWLGHGYRAFWLGESGGAGDIALSTWGLEVGQGHNSYLDILLELGLAGFSLFLAILWPAAWRALRGVREARDVLYLGHALFLAFLLVVGLVESIILERNSVYWVVFVCTVSYLRALGGRASERPLPHAPGMTRS